MEKAIESDLEEKVFFFPWKLLPMENYFRYWFNHLKETGIIFDHSQKFRQAKRLFYYQKFPLLYFPFFEEDLTGGLIS